MKKFSILLLLCIFLGAGSAWATIVGTTNPTMFYDSVLWCDNYVCNADPIAQYGTPQAWGSIGGATGMVGLVSSENMYIPQQGFSWNGNFPDGMGIVYNGNFLGNDPGGILVSFDQPQYGVGAYIQDQWFGNFTGTIAVYDAAFNFLGSFSAPGVSDTNIGTALFIGMIDSNAEIAYALFDVSDGVNPEDFGIGTLEYGPVPEPGTFLLLGPSALGLYGMLRRRLGRKEVQ